MLTCKEVSYLASKKMDKKLTLRERMGFFLHTAMCRLCRHYVSDMEALHKMMLMAGEKSMMLLPESVKLSAQSRDRIKQALAKALNQSE